jgi:uncharacterized protein YjbJ (UPF0337 family)
MEFTGVLADSRPGAAMKHFIHRVPGRFFCADQGDKAMNWDRIEGNWKQFKGQAKEQWGKLTDDDFDKAAGRRDQLAGRIQERYGIVKDDAERQIDDWLARDDAYWNRGQTM